MENGTIKRFGANLDCRIFIGSIVLVLPFIVIGIISPELLSTWSSSASALIYRFFGWLFLSSVNIIVLTCLLLALLYHLSRFCKTMVISAFSSGGRNVSGSRNDKLLILFWGSLLGVLAYVLVGSGGPKALQTASIIGALPFLFIIFSILGNFIRELVRERAYKPQP